jgi:hypothetical protein
MSVWHRHQADLHAQAWRAEVQGQLDSLQGQLEAEKAITDVIPDILAQLGPEKISETQRGQVRGYVKRLHELTGKPYPTIYDDIRLAFGPASYKDLLAADWPQVEAWFKVQIERATRGKDRR